MTCKEFIDFLDDYVTDQLPAPQRQVFDAHLAECPDCQHYLADYRRTMQLARSAFDEESGLPPDVPHDLVAAILAARRKTGSH